MTNFPQCGWSSGPTRLIRCHVFVLLVAVAPAFAQPSTPEVDTGYAKYRCTVLGDNSACAKTAEPPHAAVEERIEIGHYARYLISQRGLNLEAAIAEAATIGEYPVRRVVSVSRRPLSSFERYERLNGRPVAEERSEVTLSTTLLRPPSMQRSWSEQAPADQEDFARRARSGVLNGNPH